MKIIRHPGILILISTLGLGACAALQPPPAQGPKGGLDSYAVLLKSNQTTTPTPSEAAGLAASRQQQELAETDAAPALQKPATYPGSNTFVRRPKEVPSEIELEEGDGLVLNFENADLRDVVRTILGDFLKISYIFDPRVQGTVSLQTTSQLDPAAVLETLETLLRMNGAAMVPDGGGYRILPAEDAKGQTLPQLGGQGRPLPTGYSVVVAPLRYVSAAEMEKVLEPFVPLKTVLRTDVDRNLLILAGTSYEIKTLMETVRMFDVDWLAGMSVALFPLDQVTPEDMVIELNSIFGADSEGPLAGMVRFEPIKRLNALLVVSSQSAYLEKVGSWIKRLDKSSESGQDLYVYYLQNAKAADVASVLSEIFSGGGRSSREDFGRLAPGREPTKLESTGDAARAETRKTSSSQGARSSGALSVSGDSEVRIIADEVNNAILVLANPQDQRMVVSAIRKLDVVPLQVLIEATVAEVKLTSRLRFGLQWFFKSGDFTGIFSTGGSEIGPSFPGFSLVFNNADAKVILDALETETSLNVISSPHLMVLDNQTAELQVGDEVPVISQQQQSSVTTDAALINTVEYRNTGVIMRVTPRVNTGGSIIMEVEQEVSNLAPSAEATLTPTIQQRKFKSSIVVQSGDTVVLGGLIFDFTTKQRSGLPLLSRIPYLGALFGQTANDGDRTELVMLISPKLVRNRFEARQVTEEVRERLRQLKQLERENIPTPVWDKQQQGRQQLPAGLPSAYE